MSKHGQRPRYYDKLAQLLPEFAPDMKSSRSMGNNRPMTSFSMTRGRLISRNSVRPNAEERAFPTIPEEVITPRRCNSPFTRARKPHICVLPITITSVKTQQPKIPSLTMPEAPREKVVHKENIEEKSQEEEDIPELPTSIQPQQKTNRQSSSATDNDTDFEDESSRIFESSEISTARSTDNENDIEEDSAEVPQQIYIEGIDTTGFPYIPPLPDLQRRLDTIPESPPPSISPFTYTEEVTTLPEEDFDQFVEEDTIFLKSITQGQRFTTDNISELFLKLDDRQYASLVNIVMRQYYKLASICEHLYNYLECSSVSELTKEIEEDCENWFNCRTAMLFVYVPSASIFVNHSKLIRYPAGVGFIGTAAEEKRRVVAVSPTANILFDEENDLPLCEDAEIIVVEPIIDPSSDKVYGCILMIDKVHETGAEFMYWPQAELTLLDVLSKNLHLPFRKFVREISISSQYMKMMTRFVSREYSYVKLLGTFAEKVKQTLNCADAAVIAFSDEKWHHSYFQERTLKVKTLKENNLGIATECLNGKVVNCVKAKTHPKFLKEVDGLYADMSVLMCPVEHEGKVTGIAIAIGRKYSPVFSKFDEENLKMIGIALSIPLLCSLKMRRDTQELKAALSAQNKLAALLQTAESLSSETNTELLINRILDNATKLVEADRGSLFMVDDTRQFLISKVAHGTKQLLLPITAGLAGAVATTGETINIADVYQDPRFNSSVDKKTGYRTRSLMTVPVRDQNNELIAVAQVMNKKGGGSFNERDVELTRAMLVFTGIALANSKVIETAQMTNRNINALLDTASLLLREDSLSVILHHIMSTTRELVGADRSALFMVDSDSIESTVAEGQSTAIKVQKGRGVVGFVAQKGVTVNIKDAYQDDRFNSAVDKATGYHTRSILAAPVRDSRGEVIAVVEMINKNEANNGGTFTKDDELLTNAFSSFACMAFERHDKSSGHRNIGIMFANMMDAEDSVSCEPSTKIIIDEDTQQNFNSFRFDALQLSEVDQVKAFVWMFKEFGFCREFKITNSNLIAFILYLRDISNDKKWKHAVNSAHCVFVLLQYTGIGQFFNLAEKMGLMVAAMCKRMERVMESTEQRDIALEVIFNSSSADQMITCESIINMLTRSDGSIVANMSPENVDDFWQALIGAVKATDMKKHFELVGAIRGLLFPMKMTLAGRHRHLVGQIVLKAGSVSWAMRSFRLLEMVMDKFGMTLKSGLAFLEFFAIPMASALAEIDEGARPLLDQAESNVSVLLSKLK